MKCDLVVYRRARRRAAFATVRHEVAELLHVVQPLDSHIETVQFFSVHAICSVLQKPEQRTPLGPLQQQPTLAPLKVSNAKRLAARADVIHGSGSWGKSSSAQRPTLLASCSCTSGCPLRCHGATWHHLMSQCSGHHENAHMHVQPT
jgi:hypothetical protein